MPLTKHRKDGLYAILTDEPEDELVTGCLFQGLAMRRPMRGTEVAGDT